MNETVVPRIESANKIEMKNGMGMYKFAEPKVVDITPFSDEIFEEEVGNDKIYRQKLLLEKLFQ